MLLPQGSAVQPLPFQCGPHMVTSFLQSSGKEGKDKNFGREKLTAVTRPVTKVNDSHAGRTYTWCEVGRMAFPFYSVPLDNIKVQANQEGSSRFTLWDVLQDTCPVILRLRRSLKTRKG